jgi:hypothetical protein
VHRIILTGVIAQTPVVANKMKKPKHNISAERAKDLLNENKPLFDFYISGILNVKDFRETIKEMRIKKFYSEIT